MSNNVQNNGLLKGLYNSVRTRILYPRKLQKVFEDSIIDTNRIEAMDRLFKTGKISQETLNLTLVWATSVKNNIPILHKLLSMGADPRGDLQDSLESPCAFGYNGTAKYLLENGAAINNSKLNSFLSSAVANGHMTIAKMLINEGANPYKIDTESLNFARKHERFEILNYIENWKEQNKPQEGFPSPLRCSL